MRRGLLIAISLASAGCVGFEKNSDCRWPPHHYALALNLSSSADRRHLADDAQIAEDLAIRHADASRAPDWQRNRTEYHRVREECKALLFATVATQHSVPVASVAEAVDDRREWLDAIVIAALAIGFITAARLASNLLLRGALADSRILCVAMILAAALASGAVAVLCSGFFIGVIESVRVGNGHMSYRVERLPLRHRPIETFAASAMLFAAIATTQYQRNSSKP